MARTGGKTWVRQIEVRLGVQVEFLPPSGRDSGRGRLCRRESDVSEGAVQDEQAVGGAWRVVGADGADVEVFASAHTGAALLTAVVREEVLSAGRLVHLEGLGAGDAEPLFAIAHFDDACLWMVRGDDDRTLAFETELGWRTAVVGLHSVEVLQLLVPARGEVPFLPNTEAAVAGNVAPEFVLLEAESAPEEEALVGG